MSVEEEEGAEKGGGGKGGARKHVPSHRIFIIGTPCAGHSYLTGRTNGHRPPSFSTYLGEYLAALLVGAFAHLPSVNSVKFFLASSLID